MSTVLPPSVADLHGVLSETKRIIRAHTRHFLHLSVLFLLPVPFTILALRSFSASAADNQSFPLHTVLRLPTSYFHLAIPLKTLAFLIAFSATSLLLLLSAVASITFSAFHGFHDRSVKLRSAFLSISRNFLPLLATSAAALLCIAVVVSSFALYEFLSWKAISLIGGESATDSPYFLAISAIGALISSLVVANFTVDWILVGAVVVIENRSGFKALSRSKELVSGMRWTAMSLMLIFGIGAVFVMWINFSPFPVNRNQWWDFALFFAMFAPAVLVASFLLNLIAASTVLYVYCKAVRGESYEEFAGAEYDCLPFDDDERSREQALPNQTPTLV